MRTAMKPVDAATLNLLWHDEDAREAHLRKVVGDRLAEKPPPTIDDQVVATDLVSGASILGDGRVVLILNLAAIIERVSRMRPEQAGTVLSGLLLSQGALPKPRDPQTSTEVQA